MRSMELIELLDTTATALFAISVHLIAALFLITIDQLSRHIITLGHPYLTPSASPSVHKFQDSPFFPRSPPRLSL
jgi:hypothetical protein